MLENNFKIVKDVNYDMIKEQLDKNGNNCPCVPTYAWDDDSKCMCKTFREQKFVGSCHCGAFKKVLSE